MRGSDFDTVSALARSRHDGIVPRYLVSISARPLAGGDAELFCFWNGVLPVDIAVIGGRTGAVETRAFAADNALLEVGKIRLTSDLSIRPATFRLNPAHPRVKAMMDGYNLRLAPVEIHRGLLDVDTRLLVAPPRCRFLGFIETVPRRRAPVGEVGSLTFSCISETVQLTRTNPAKRSDETQKLRSGDRMMKYAEVAAQWEIPWGQAAEESGS